MRPSELITVYLAAAAPVGVVYFLRHRTNMMTGVRALSRAACAALLWPLALVAICWREGEDDPGQVRGEAQARTIDGAREAKIERAERELLFALHGIEDLLPDDLRDRNEEARRTIRYAREMLERYVGLALAARGARADASPSARELELCRVAGRSGEDLLIAGRCIHRTNVARLRAHHERARTQFLHALAEVREPHASLRTTASGTDAHAARRLSEALLRLYGRAVELFYALDDGSAAETIARLLEVERARLVRLDARSPDLVRPTSRAHAS